MTPHNDTNGAGARAFGEGCDARLSGLRPSDNPHLHDGELWRLWARGYANVEASWGMLVKGRWKVRELPEVKA